MDWGLKNRLSRIINPKTGKVVMLAVDHGYFLGPTSGLEDLKKTLDPLIPYADTLMLTRGALRASVAPEFDVPVMLRVSGGNSIVTDDLSNEDLTVSIEEAIRLNVSGVAMSVYVGSKHQHRTLVNLGKLINEANRYGIAVLAVTAVGKEMTRDARYLSLACRIAAEQGAHIVKTYYCDDFEKVVNTCPVPVVIAGGKKIEEKDALKLAYNAISRGAVGVDMGRNIFQSDAPVAMIKAVRRIVHKKASVEEAFELYSSLKNKKRK